MFRAYPEARLVYDAERTAIKANILPSEKFTGYRRDFSRPNKGRAADILRMKTWIVPDANATGSLRQPRQRQEGAKASAKALHVWRSYMVARMTQRLNDSLQSVANPFVRSERAYIFLINEFKWLELRASATQFSLSSSRYGPEGASTRIFTSRRILNALLNGHLRWQTGVAKKLIVLRGTRENVSEWQDVLRSAVAKQGMSIRRPRAILE